MIKVKNTDKPFAKNVMVASSFHHKDNGQAPDFCAMLVQQAITALREHLSFPEDITVRLCRIRTRGEQGNHRIMHGKHVIEIDIRRAQKAAALHGGHISILTTLCHELVHAEQHHEGRLDIQYERTGTSKNGFPTYEWVRRWNGEVHQAPSAAYSGFGTAYRELPWEAEAFGRQNELFQLIWAQMPTTL
jgi:hypothetical protein